MLSTRSTSNDGGLRPAKAHPHATRRPLQAKLSVSEPGDALEREADRVASEVMRMPESQAQPPRIQRLCSSCEEDLQREAGEEGGTRSSDLESYVGGLSGRGEPLGTEARSFFEPRFGVDLTAVRIHRDAEADRSASSIDALAYTAGEHIVFRAGRYDSGSDQGRHLLAHELTHVLQQGGSSTPGSVSRQASSEVHVVDNLGCPREDCAGKEDGIRADLRRALGYTAQALQALQGGPSGSTERLLDWYFNDHSEATVNTVRERLQAIRAALQETLDHDHYGCGHRSWDVAHTGGSDTLLVDSNAPVCLDPPYFEADRSERDRAEALIHECGHRVGLSIRETGTPDIYSPEWAFLNLGNRQAMLTTESYAKFASAVALGAPTNFLPLLSAAGGISSLGGFFSASAGAEVENPALRGVSPRAGISVAKLGPDVVGSLFLGARLAGARPGDHGSVYLGVSGQLSFISSPGDRVGLGTGAQAELGYRIGHFDIGVAGGALRDSSPQSGARTVYFGGLSFTYIPLREP